MKNGKAAFLPLVLFFVITVFGCRETIIAVTDPVWERYVAAVPDAEPDWLSYLNNRNYRVIAVDNPGDAGNWEVFLRRYSPGAVFWEPMLDKEAEAFSTAHPEILSLLPGPRILSGSSARNLIRISENRIPAFELLGKAAREDIQNGKHVLAVFSSETRERQEEKLAFDRGLGTKKDLFYREFIINNGRDQDEAGKFLTDAMKNNPDFVILSAAGADADLYKILTDRELRIFLETDGGIQKDDPRIIGIFYADWEKILKEVLAVSPETWETGYEVKTEFLLSGALP